MKISLKLNYDGEPYIVLLSDKPALDCTEQCTDAESLEFFIREAREKGIEIKNESGMETRNDYASIRLKKAVRESGACVGYTAEMWAWWDNKREIFSHVYQSEGLVAMCSPDGFKGAEKRGEGVITKVRIKAV